MSCLELNSCFPNFTFSFNEMWHSSVNDHPQRPHIGPHHFVKILNSAVHEGLSEKYGGIVRLQITTISRFRRYNKAAPLKSLFQEILTKIGKFRICHKNVSLANFSFSFYVSMKTPHAIRNVFLQIKCLVSMFYQDVDLAELFDRSIHQSVTF